MQLQIFGGATVVLVLVFAIATCCAKADGPSIANLNRSADGRSCVLFPKLGLKTPVSQGALQVPPVHTLSQLLVDPLALQMGRWPLFITEIDGKTVFHVKLVDKAHATFSKSISRRSGSMSSLEATMSWVSGNDKPASQSIEICTPDGTPTVAVTSDMQIHSMAHRRAVAKLEAFGSGQYQLHFLSGWSPDVVIVRNKAAVLLVTPHGHAPLASAAPVWHTRQSIGILFDPNVASQPLVKVTFLAALMGMIVFHGDLRD